MRRRDKAARPQGSATRPTDEEMLATAEGDGGNDAVPDVAQTRTELIALSIVRLAMAGYRTGQVSCWEAAFSATGEILGPVDGPAVFGRVIALVHAVRCERVGTFVFLPAACRDLSADERDLVLLIRAARGPEWPGLDASAARFGGRATAPLIRLAARAPGVLLDRLDQAAAIGPDRLEVGGDTPRPTRH